MAADLAFDAKTAIDPVPSGERLAKTLTS